MRTINKKKNRNHADFRANTSVVYDRRLGMLFFAGFSFAGKNDLSETRKLGEQLLLSTLKQNHVDFVEMLR